MPKVYSYMKPNAQVVDYAGGRLHEIKNEIEQLVDERKMFEHLLLLMRYHTCNTCKGGGSVTVARNDGDGMTSRECPTCEGSGEPAVVVSLRGAA